MTGRTSRTPSCARHRTRIACVVTTEPRRASGANRSPGPDQRTNHAKRSAQGVLTSAAFQRSVAAGRQRVEMMPDRQPKRADVAVAAPDALAAVAAEAPRRVEAAPAQLGWLIFWMSGTLAAFIVAALSVRALSDSLNAFEMMTIRSAGGLAILLAI